MITSDMAVTDGVPHACSHPLYAVWRNLFLRTTTPVSHEWLHFAKFIEDVQRPKPKHVLVPADRSKPFGPGNFTWVDQRTFRAFLTSVKWIKCRGICMPVNRWALVLEVPYASLGKLATDMGSHSKAIEHLLMSERSKAIRDRILHGIRIQMEDLRLRIPEPMRPLPYDTDGS